MAVQMATKLAKQDTAIVDSVASGWYFTPGAPVSNVNKTAAKIRVGTATGHAKKSEASCELPLPELPPGLFGHIMTGFTHNLFGIGDICDKECKVLFTKQSGSIYDRNDQPFLKGWRETSGAKLWRISLRPDLRPDIAKCPPSNEDTKADLQEKQATLEAFSTYDLPSVEALVIYFNAAAGYPVRDTRLKAIKASNYDSWPGLTYINATNYCPSADEIIKGHMVHTRQRVRSTKPKKTSKRGLQGFPEIDESTPGNDSVNELYVQVIQKHILYTDDTGRFRIRDRSGNQYVLVAYHS